MYNAEVAPPEIRGSLVALNNCAIGFGIMIAYWIDYGCNYIGGTGSTQSNAAWIIPVALQVPTGLILIVGMIFMPFSPRWLMMRGHGKETRSVLAKLRRLPEDDEVIELEYLEIQAQCRFEKATITEKYPHLESPTTMNIIKLQLMAFASLFQTKAMFRRVMVVTVMQTFVQWVGVDAVLYYAPTMFAGLGISSNTTGLLATGVVGILIFLGTIVAVLYVDRLGRKIVLIVGAIGMAASLLIIAVIVATCSHDWPAHSTAEWAAISMVWFYIFNFGYSWGPVAFVVTAEIWPMSTRAVGIALGLSANWMSNFVVGQVTPDMLQTLGYGTYIFFGVMACLAGVFTWLFVPETKRLTLEEMDIVFGSEGTAQADVERMHRIHVEIGLYDLLHRSDPVDNEKSRQGGVLSAVEVEHFDKQVGTSG
ncbi:hypothetical protein B0A49_12493 [Cryomyces minteri]|uniref:Major facilitator superfamily (MFS) profile domain-containing protein n=1 Tax=Cryomyces minteri TaxID=331657 RepID=A0A4U0WR13_9PEZI|nr:hypothetical protein B0A49_12493 [Cryomyces minteri]